MPNPSLGNIGQAIGQGIQNLATHTAKAANTANGISWASQNAQGAFNQASANLANQIGSERIAQQYGYNSAQAASQYAYNESMWDKAAAWNEAMMQRQMEFNEEQAQINRDWQERMRATSYQTAVKDMERAGLNPILAATGGGVMTGAGAGSTASTSAPSMSSAAGGMASGGLLNGLAASEGNFTGQMEYMSGMLGLISAVLGGFSSAAQGLGTLGDFGESLGNAIAKIFMNDKTPPTETKNKTTYKSDGRHPGLTTTYENEKIPNVWELIPGFKNTWGWIK